MGIVLVVLMVWAGAIALFFNRWGKIRMLLPYQPDYKQDQLKVPGTGVCAPGACNGTHTHSQVTEMVRTLLLKLNFYLFIMLLQSASNCLNIIQYPLSKIDYF